LRLPALKVSLFQFVVNEKQNFFIKEISMKLLIGIPIYRRPKIVNIQLNYTMDVLVPHIKNKGLDVEVLVVGSDNVDTEIMQSFSDITYVCIPNVLSDKFNHLMRYAQDFDFDYLMTLGSDDLMPKNLFDDVFDLVNENGFIASPSQTWMCDMMKSQVFKWTGYSDQKRVLKKYGLGSGRIYSKNTISKLSRSPFGEGLMMGMESTIASELDVILNGLSNFTVFMDAQDFLFALKTNENIWKINSYIDVTFAKAYLITDRYFEWIPNNIKEKMLALKESA
jgi:hypothetical protein